MQNSNVPNLKLVELIKKELGDKEIVNVDIQTLYDSIESKEYTRLISGMFLPEIGVLGDWTTKEKQEIKSMTAAREQEHNSIYYVARAICGYDDDEVTKYKKAYDTIEQMNQGDIAKIRLNNSTYAAIAFPAEFPATALVLFVKTEYKKSFLEKILKI